MDKPEQDASLTGPLLPDQLLLKPSRAAQLIDISRSKLYELASSGVIPSVRLEGGRLLRIPYSALRRIAESSGSDDPAPKVSTTTSVPRKSRLGSCAAG